MLQFNDNELKAILKVAKAMVLADGKVEKKELLVMTNELIRFGISREKIEGLAESAKNMDNSEALIALSKLDEERKKYVSAYLIMIMIIDGEMHDKEMILWELTTSLCGLPEINISEAIQLMSSL